jgi:hypothetical protein
VAKPPGATLLRCLAWQPLTVVGGGMHRIRPCRGSKRRWLQGSWCIAEGDHVSKTLPRSLLDSARHATVSLLTGICCDAQLLPNIWCAVAVPQCASLQSL